MKLKTKDDALRFYAKWCMRKLIWHQIYGSEEKSGLIKQMVKEWQADGVIIHLNRGCEGTGIGAMENYLALKDAGIPVVTYEGNMADPRECDRGKIFERIDDFIEILGVNQ